MARRSDNALETVPFDAAEHLGSPEAQAELLADAFASGGITYITTALGTVARARGMTDVAKTACISREALHKALSKDGDPRLSTVLGVMRALGLKLKAEAA